MAGAPRCFFFSLLTSFVANLRPVCGRWTSGFGVVVHIFAFGVGWSWVRTWPCWCREAFLFLHIPPSPWDLEPESGFQIARQRSDLVIYPIRLKCIYYMLKHIPVSSENEPQDCPGMNFQDPLEQVQEKHNLLRGKQNQVLIQSASALGSTSPNPCPQRLKRGSVFQGTKVTWTLTCLWILPPHRSDVGRTYVPFIYCSKVIFISLFDTKVIFICKNSVK